MSERLGPPPYRPRPGTIPTLPVPDGDAWQRLHLIGVGGAGMSGIARILLARGIAVTGSDLKASRGLTALEAMGATVFVGHRAEQVGDPDAVVISTAIRANNAELASAGERGIPVLTRAQVLAALMRGGRGVAVAGTHGKTTTSSMISVMLSRVGLRPTFVIGGDLNESGSGAEPGDGDVFVAEADESDGSFLLLEPEIAVITNVEADHLDFWADREEVESAFAAFASRARWVVACWDDPGVRRALAGGHPGLVRYGIDAGDEVAVAALELHGETAGATVTIRPSGGGAGVTVPLRLAVPGAHNVLNAAASLAVAGLLGIEPAAAADALASFSGVRRRFERRGVAAGASFVDDYAHHPTEVEATMLAARSVAEGADGVAGRVVAVFQPHRYTRTEAMWRALGESLRGADVVVVTDVYGAGEEPIPGVSGKLVVEALAEAAPGKRVVYLPRRAEVASFLASLVRPGDLVLTLGAGDITMVADETLDLMREAAS